MITTRQKIYPKSSKTITFFGESEKSDGIFIKLDKQKFSENFDYDIAEFFELSINFPNIEYAALFADAEYYYISLIPVARDQLDVKKWQNQWATACTFIESTPVHHASAQYDITKAYQFVVRQFPIYDLDKTRAFYNQYNNADLDQFVLKESKRCVDYDFINVQSKSLFVFSRNEICDSTQSFHQTLSQSIDADLYKNFLYDLDILVKDLIGKPKILVEIKSYNRNSFENNEQLSQKSDILKINL